MKTGSRRSGGKSRSRRVISWTVTVTVAIYLGGEPLYEFLAQLTAKF